MGRPSAPPTPSMPLMSATPEACRSAGTTAATSEIPRGTVPAASPWTVRPTMSQPMLLLIAVMREPTTMVARLTSSMRRLPYRSPSRPNSGTATAPASTVEVTSHCVVLALVPSCAGSVGSTGTNNDWASAETRAPAATSPTTRPG